MRCANKDASNMPSHINPLKEGSLRDKAFIKQNGS